MYLNIGIDVSKNKHDACILNENGEQIGKFMKLTNTKTSLDKFLEQIKIISEKHDAKLRIGLEATGIYWYSIFTKISGDHKISIYNPIQIHAFAKVNVRGSKTDKIDAKRMERGLIYCVSIRHFERISIMPSSISLPVNFLFQIPLIGAVSRFKIMLDSLLLSSVIQISRHCFHFVLF